MPEKPSDEVSRVRARGKEILDSLRNDPRFLAQLREDPVAALVVQGIPKSAALEWQKPHGEVSGYDDNCVFTCIYSTDNAGCFETVTY